MNLTFFIICNHTKKKIYSTLVLVAFKCQALKETTQMVLIRLWLLYICSALTTVACGP